MGEALLNGPSSDRMIPNIPLALAMIFISGWIVVILLIIAGLAIFEICAALTILGPGSFLVALLPLQFTKDLAQGYFTWLIRVGVIILFFFVIFGMSQNLIQQWTTNIANVCGSTLTTLPSPVLSAPAQLVSATPCIRPIPMHTLLTLMADVTILALIAIGVPFTAGSIVSHGVNMTLEHFATATYLAKSVGAPVAAAVGGLSHQIKRMGSAGYQQFQQRMKAGAQAAANTRPSTPRPSGPNQFGVKPTARLNPGGSKVTRKNTGNF
jgi:hypothetical protein